MASTPQTSTATSSFIPQQLARAARPPPSSPLKPFFVDIDVRFFRHRPRSRDQQARYCHPLHRATESECQATSFVFHGGSWWEAWWSRWDNKLLRNAGTLRSTLPLSSIFWQVGTSCSSFLFFSGFFMEVLFSLSFHILYFFPFLYSHTPVKGVSWHWHALIILFLCFLARTHLRPGRVVTPHKPWTVVVIIAPLGRRP